MKNRTLLRIGICVAVLLVPMQVYAVGPQDISSTAHNLAYSATNPRQWSSADPASAKFGTLEVCVFCHTPHNSSGDLPLWNRYSTNTAQGFLMYTSSSTLTSVVKSNPGLSVNSSSRLCLTCHDGTTALNALVTTTATEGARPDFAGTSDVSFDESGAYEESPGEYLGAYLGTNLTNMHPINFNYASAQVQEGDGLNTIAIVEADLKFFDDDKDGTFDFMECATCHDPHVSYGWFTIAGGLPSGTGDTRYTPFLRKPNVSSGLCLTCHNK